MSATMFGYEIWHDIKWVWGKHMPLEYKHPLFPKDSYPLQARQMGNSLKDEHKRIAETARHGCQWNEAEEGSTRCYQIRRASVYARNGLAVIWSWKLDERFCKLFITMVAAGVTDIRLPISFDDGKQLENMLQLIFQSSELYLHWFQGTL